MKVLYLINHAGKAGTEKYVLNLVKAYNNTKCECYFLTSYQYCNKTIKFLQVVFTKRVFYDIL